MDTEGIDYRDHVVLLWTSSDRWMASAWRIDGKAPGAGLVFSAESRQQVFEQARASVDRALGEPLALAS